MSLRRLSAKLTCQGHENRLLKGLKANHFCTLSLWFEPMSAHSILHEHVFQDQHNWCDQRWRKLHQHRPQIEIKTLNSGSALFSLSLAQHPGQHPDTAQSQTWSGAPWTAPCTAPWTAPWTAPSTAPWHRPRDPEHPGQHHWTAPWTTPWQTWSGAPCNSTLDSTLTPPNGKHDPEHPGQHPGQHPDTPMANMIRSTLNSTPAQHPGQHPDTAQWQTWSGAPWTAPLHSTLDSTLTPPNGKHDPEHPDSTLDSTLTPPNGKHDPEHPGQHPQQHPWQHPAQHSEQHPDVGQLANTMPPFEKLEPL